MHVTRHAQHARIYTHHPADAKPCKYGSNSRGITSAGIVSGDFGNQGVGAEMQERLCAFAFARKINTAYVHLPLYALTHMSRTPELPEKLEEFFGLRKLASWTVAASRAGIVAVLCHPATDSGVPLRESKAALAVRRAASPAHMRK